MLRYKHIKRTSRYKATVIILPTQQAGTTTWRRRYYRSSWLLCRPAPDIFCVSAAATACLWPIPTHKGPDQFVLDEEFRAAAKRSPMLWAFMQAVDQAEKEQQERAGERSEQLY